MATHRIDRTGPAFLAQRTARLRELCAVDDLGRAQGLEVFGFGSTPGRGHHGVAQLGEDRHRHAAHAAIGAGDQHFALVRVTPWRSSAITHSIAV